MASIYVTSLSDYNAGNLHGRWIDLDCLSAEDVHKEIAEMLRESKHPNVRVKCPDCEHERDSQRCEPCGGYGTVPSAEEWAVFDYDGLPSSFGEHPDIDELVEYVEKVEEHGDAWVAYLENVGAGNADEDNFNDTYAGSADTELEWVENYLEECGTLDSIPENLRRYFDYEAFLRDMRMGGEVSFENVDGTVYAFYG